MWSTLYHAIRRLALAVPIVLVLALGLTACPKNTTTKRGCAGYPLHVRRCPDSPTPTPPKRHAPAAKSGRKPHGVCQTSWADVVSCKVNGTWVDQKK